MKKLLEENETLTQIVNDVGRPPTGLPNQPPGRIQQSKSRNLLQKSS